MREILFRGKRIDSGQWAESRCPDGVMCAGTVINDFDQYTVGQWTGMTDKNGRKIFEGDVVNHRLMFYETIRTGIVEYSDNFGAFFIIGSGYSDNQMYAFCDFEVIGNRWDNPELMEDYDEGKSS